jgi:uncharacterized membrane protein
MEDFVKFKKFITPTFIQILFWIGVAVSVILGLIMIISGAVGHERGFYAARQGGGGGMVLLGFLFIILGPILWRIYCEVLMVIFTINDTLVDIKKQLSNQDTK